VDLRPCDDKYWEDIAALSPGRGATILLSNKVPNPKIMPLAIEPTWGLWNGGRSGVSIDFECNATVPGLLAAGVCAKNLATGTHASAGVPTAYSMNSGYYAGEFAAKFARANPYPDLPRDAVRKLAEHAMAPLTRAGRGPGPDDLHDELCRLESSVVETMRLNGDKLAHMLARAKDVKALAQTARAENLHDLAKLHEAENIAEAGEAIYSSALDRTESREQFYREDYPETDDENWFVWHGVTKTQSGSKFERLAIPLDGPLKPKGMRPKHPSPIAAIMAGNYDYRTYD
jgi:succinate dehydrogenase/fumarate reductase flavoprotein subunit